jgi:hypothetical protein
VTRLTRSARGLLVALAALALTGGAVFAARSLPSAASSGTQHASTVSGKTVPAPQGAGAPDSNSQANSDENAEQETPETETDTTTGIRPQNHGWFVSQAAQTDTTTGIVTHGAYVSSIAKGDLGKPDAASNGADKSAAGKAKAAAAQARAAAAKAARGD